MPRSGSNTSLDVRHVMRNAAVAAMLSDPTGTEALLLLPDAEVGRLFRTHLIQVIGAATVSNLDLSSTREEDEARSRLTSRRGTEFPRFDKRLRSQHGAVLPRSARQTLTCGGFLQS